MDLVEDAAVDIGATLVQVPPGASPTGPGSVNRRRVGGVKEGAKSAGTPSVRRMSGKELVEIPRLTRTIIDPVLGRIYPTDQPVKVSYSVAATFGLLPVAQKAAPVVEAAPEPTPTPEPETPVTPESDPIETDEARQAEINARREALRP